MHVLHSSFTCKVARLYTSLHLNIFCLNEQLTNIMSFLSLLTTLVSWTHIYIQIACENFVKCQSWYQAEAKLPCKMMILHWQLLFIAEKLFFLQVSVFIPRKVCPPDIQLPSAKFSNKKIKLGLSDKVHFSINPCWLHYVHFLCSWFSYHLFYYFPGICTEFSA